MLTHGLRKVDGDASVTRGCSGGGGGGGGEGVGADNDITPYPASSGSTCEMSKVRLWSGYDMAPGPMCTICINYANLMFAPAQAASVVDMG